MCDIWVSTPTSVPGVDSAGTAVPDSQGRIVRAHRSHDHNSSNWEWFKHSMAGEKIQGGTSIQWKILLHKKMKLSLNEEETQSPLKYTLQKSETIPRNMCNVSCLEDDIPGRVKV